MTTHFALLVYSRTLSIGRFLILSRSVILIRLGLLGCLVLLSACASNPAISKVKTVPKNSELLIGEFGYWKRDCTKRHFDIFIERYPKGGDLRFEVGSLIIPEDPLVGSSGKCVGKDVQSKRVIYIADPGFVGSDSVRYVVKSSSLLKDKAYEIDLQVQ